MNSEKNVTLLALLSLGVIVLTFAIGLTIPQQLIIAMHTPSPVNDTATTRRLSLINRAVRTSPTTAYFDYSADFENPFKQWNEQRIVKSTMASRRDTIARVMLSLKGILIKDKPLAILDNGLGETQIRAAGEKAFDQLIIEITDKHVVMRDHRGKYEITVEE